MNDEYRMSLTTHLAFAVTGLLAVGLAVFASGPLAVLGGVIAAGCFLATAAPETGCDTSREQCLIETLTRKPRPEPVWPEELETGTHWQERVSVREVNQRMH